MKNVSDEKQAKKETAPKGLRVRTSVQAGPLNAYMYLKGGNG